MKCDTVKTARKDATAKDVTLTQHNVQHRPTVKTAQECLKLVI